MARPKLELSAESVERMAAIGCTTAEIAAVLGCSPDTIERNYAESKERGYLRMKVSVRRMQFQSAQTGNVTMQIWLGKNHLGQSDKQTVVTADAGRVPAEFVNNFNAFLEQRGMTPALVDDAEDAEYTPLEPAKLAPPKPKSFGESFDAFKKQHGQ